MITVTGKTLQKVKDTAKGLARVEPAEVAVALGAEPVAKGATRTQSPLALFALRQGLAERLRSTGGRPGLGELRRQKIPLSDADWEILVTLAEAVADEEIHPTPGQLASEILHRQLTELRDQLRGADHGKDEVTRVARRLSAPAASLHAAAASSTRAVRNSSR